MKSITNTAPNKNAPKLTNATAINALNNAALSRRAALQVEMGVTLLHFTDEGDTTSQAKSNLKSLYHASGYQCEAKVDRDYKTVNRRMNAGVKLFEKLGSSIIHSWTEDLLDLEALQAIVNELAVMGLESIDDVLEYVGAASNKTRAPRQPLAAVVTKVAPEPVAEKEEEAAPVAMTVAQFTADIKAQLLQQLTTEEIQAFIADLLVSVAATEEALKKAA